MQFRAVMHLIALRTYINANFRSSIKLNVTSFLIYLNHNSLQPECETYFERLMNLRWRQWESLLLCMRVRDTPFGPQ